MMRRLALPALLFLVVAFQAAPASACAGTLQNVVQNIDARFADHPHSTVYECMRPFFGDGERSTDYDDATPAAQETFLFAILKNARKLMAYERRADYHNFVKEAAIKYLALCEGNNALPRNRCQHALDSWGRSSLLLNDWTVLKTLADYAESGTGYFNGEVVKLWEAAFRCRSQPDCAAKQFGCALVGQCGTREQLETWASEPEVGRPQCRAFATFLARAVSEPRLGVTAEKRRAFDSLCPP